MEEFCDSCHTSRMPAMQFHCPHCGALYEKTDTKIAARDDAVVQCVVCRNTMYKTGGSPIPSFKLLKRPESDTQ